MRVLVDAEYTYMNPALSLVTMAMMKKFNRDDAWIWNTYQCYLKANISVQPPLEAAQGCPVYCASALLLFCVHQESRALVLEALRLSQDEGFCLGVKLVRGAYMDKERMLAEKEGRPDPVHASWEDTNERWTYTFISSQTHSLKHAPLLVCAVTTLISTSYWTPFPRILSVTGSS